MQKANLNLIPGKVRPVINVSQYDEGRQFQLALFIGPDVMDLTGKTVTIEVGKADGNGCAYGATDEVNGVPVVAVTNNVVTITTPIQMTACAGDNMAELKVAFSGNKIGTLNFILNCEPAALDPDTPVSETDIPAIEAAGWAAVQHYPYINVLNNHWMAWDVVNGVWFDTGVNAGSGGTGTTDYNDLANRPQINGNLLSGNKTAGDLDLASDDPMTGATSGDAGAAGLVPAPAAGDQSKYLRGDGTWQNAATALTDLTDTDIASPTNGQTLVYDDTTNKWKNGAGGGGGSSTLAGLTDVSISSATDGQPLLYDNANSKWVNGGGVIPIANGGTGNADGYVRAGQLAGSTMGTRSTAEGHNTTASGTFSHAEGEISIASGSYGAHAEGSQTTASGVYSHAEGGVTTASGAAAHAEGFQNTASGGASHVEGAYNQATAQYTHAGGFQNSAGYQYQTVIGKYNHNESDSLFEIGNGTSNNDHVNALAVKNDGRVIVNGNDALVSGSDMAPVVEQTRTMSAQRAAGSYVFVVADKKTYYIDTTIASGGTLTPGTNATESTPFEKIAGLTSAVNTINSDLADIIKVKNISHLYTIDGAGGCHWNPTSDTGFNETGYTPLGIIGYISDTTTTYFTSIWSESTSWSMMMHGTPNATGTVQYTVLYLKNLTS